MIIRSELVAGPLPNLTQRVVGSKGILGSLAHGLRLELRGYVLACIVSPPTASNSEAKATGG